MRFHAILLGLVLAFFGVSAGLAVILQNPAGLDSGLKTDIDGLIESLPAHLKARTEINFSELYGSSGQFEVLHPLLELPHLRLIRPSTSCESVDPADADRSQGVTCDPKLIVDRPFQNQMAKQKALESFLEMEGALPKNFIETPPFVGPAGYSYAYFLSQKDFPPFNEAAWVERHLSFFKISELKDVLAKYNLNSPAFSLIATLSEDEAEEIVRGADTIQTPTALFVRDSSRFGFSPLSYRVFDLADVHAALKESKYDFTSAGTAEFCILKTGNLCWTYSSKRMLSYLQRYSDITAFVFGVMFLVLLASFIRHLAEKRRDENKHRLALQVLSHEFRTPVASLLLTLDQLSRNQNRFTPEEQDLITRSNAEAFRLQRVIEVSKNYLQAKNGRIHLNSIEIPSINEWIGDFIEESKLEIECRLLAHDRSIRADPFWMKFVLSNLVQNAFVHGKAPVRIYLALDGGSLKISVEDQGTCEFSSLNEMTGAFVKSSRSQGMGLGLGIVKAVTEAAGGEIRFSKGPTAFTLLLKNSEAN